ncbi:hypothetical protein [Bosea sp. (in: a-proteobacteria)]
MRRLLIAAGLALAAFAASPAGAAPQSAPPVALGTTLDKLPAEYTRHRMEHRRVYRHHGYYSHRHHRRGPPHHAHRRHHHRY